VAGLLLIWDNGEFKMNYKNGLFIILLFIFSSGCFAELIDGPANIRDNPNGRAIFSLNNNVEVEVARDLKNGWFEIMLDVFCDKEGLMDYNDGKFTFKNMMIKKGVPLYDAKGNKIGIALENFHAYDTPEFNGQVKRFSILIHGFTFPGNIIESSKAENMLAELINGLNDFDVQYFENHIKTFGYNQWGSHWNPKGDFSGYVYSGTSIARFETGRIALVFYHNKLAAIIHQREIKLKNFKDESYVNSSQYHIFRINKNLGSKLEDYCHTITMWVGQ
jgi:hypothetical protein